MSEGLRTHIASLTPSGQTDAVIHPRAFAILKAHGNASMLSRQFGELLSQAGLMEGVRPMRLVSLDEVDSADHPLREIIHDDC